MPVCPRRDDVGAVVGRDVLIIRGEERQNRRAVGADGRGAVPREAVDTVREHAVGRGGGRRPRGAERQRQCDRRQHNEHQQRGQNPPPVIIYKLSDSCHISPSGYSPEFRSVHCISTLKHSALMSA